MVHWIKEHQLINPHSHVLVAVSGGPDSLALLHFLATYREQLHITVSVVTVDHQLRDEDSLEDVRFVEEQCKILGIACFARSVNVPEYKRKYQLGTQAAARAMRYNVFQELMQQEKADYIALGHHADDQLETVIMQLTKRTHLHNITGIPLKREFGNGTIIRPFLCVTKQEIEQYCEQKGLEPRIDVTNLEKAYTRNRIRLDVIPKLKQENPNLAMTIQQLTNTLQEDESYLMSEAKKLFSQLVYTDLEGKKATISVKGFQGCPVSLQRRLFRLLLDYLYLSVPNQITYKHETAFLELFTQKGYKILHFPEGCFIEKSYDNVYCHFQQQHTKQIDFEQIIPSVPVQIELPDGAILKIRRVKETGCFSEDAASYTYVYPENRASFPFIIRTRKPGDRMTYDGLTGTKKIKDIFIDEKIPLKTRQTRCMLTDSNHQILWLIGLKKYTQKQPPELGTYLVFEYVEKDA